MRTLCGNLGEGKCFASSSVTAFTCTEPLVLLPSESWGMTSKWGLQFCLCISKRKWVLSSLETPFMSVFWKLSFSWRNKLIFWKINTQTNLWQKGKNFGFWMKLPRVNSRLLHKNINTFGSIFFLCSKLSSQLQTPQQACTWRTFSMQQKLW